MNTARFKRNKNIEEIERLRQENEELKKANEYLYKEVQELNAMVQKLNNDNVERVLNK